jgi:hypothetical protein
LKILLKLECCSGECSQVGKGAAWWNLIHRFEENQTSFFKAITHNVQDQLQDETRELDTKGQLHHLQTVDDPCVQHNPVHGVKPDLHFSTCRKPF